MFEATQGEKESSSSKLWIGIFVVVAVCALGVLYYVMSKRPPKPPAPSPEAMAAATAKADPLKDLKVQRASMDKDRTGTTAAWLVEIENRSTEFTYSDIKYQTDYMGADNKAVLVNQGTIDATIAPGDVKHCEFNDALYPAGTAWFKFKITGAKASIAQ
jgi:2',3'-cyclic-nucleotide 2'-phosphodiesterase (5'-nucleotidase family)